ncbi:type 1 glutamine amidotransferase domain-containing protein [Luteolibacter luteus]|uniref:Type 1 glutamine amidotransferase n=1 Tax=Luteolibacter luteus TaxID=2728835 RepID=A0A858RNI3_9BACT|nr:type 1 glutamine amidotransferase domain-containing protein [Luteolibacter luteus]QJE98161.1 type 1 glutamine amidotransferase [Luteolibacter luteus]
MKTEKLSSKHDLHGVRVAVLATDGFEQSELMVPVDALESCGARVDIITPEGDGIRGWDEENWGQIIAADHSLDDVAPEDYHALLLPGGVLNSDALRMLPDAREFVSWFFKDDKHVFVICHGSQVLIDAGVVKGRTMTSYKAIATDLKNAGAKWKDEEVVHDGKLISSRSPDDLPAFCAAVCSALDHAKSAVGSR